MMKKTENKWALITGATGGFGKEFCQQLAEQGFNIFLVAREPEMLKKLKAELENKHSIDCRILSIDLSNPASAEKVFDEVQKENISIHLLINNAGFGDYGDLAQTHWGKQKEMITLNCMTLTGLTRLFLPSMIKNNQGQILNVASVAAFLPGPKMSVYYATKAYVLSFTEAIAEELKDTGIQVSVLCPEPTKTGFAGAAHADKSQIFKGGLSDPAEIVTLALTSLNQGKIVIIHGFKRKVALFLSRFLPRKTIRKISSRMNSKSL